MSNGYKPIKDAIVSILGGVTGLKIVYGKEEKAIKQFPAACVSAQGDDEAFDSIGSSGTNEVNIRHIIRVYFRLDEQLDKDYEDILETVVDDIKQALRSNVTLNGTCEYSVPSFGQWRTGMKETPVRVYELTNTANVHLRRDTGELI